MLLNQSLRTPWAPSEPCPWPEYPRPQMVRENWLNLNGWWDYTILPATSSAPQQYEGQILVPFPLESALSGVQTSLLPNQRLWYRRSFQIPGKYLEKGIDKRQKVLLHFGAVDYQCEVWVNHSHAGSHSGGYLPFTLDITGVLVEGNNELVVSVWDPTDTGLQQRGKQVLRPQGIWYTPVSGIWQTVWLEIVPETSIEALRLTPDLDAHTLQIEVKVRGDYKSEPAQIEVEARFHQELIAVHSGQAGIPLAIHIPNPKEWSPDHPHLYGLRVRLVHDGQVLDEVGSYFAMRKFGLVRDARGQVRFALNNQPIFLYGPLDQGYFPDGLYTPPSEEAMLFDLEYTRKIGCNMIRKHVKVESLRWYYHCDRLGLIVWQDMPNGGRIDGAFVATITMLFGFHRSDTRRLSRFGRAQADNRTMYRAEMQALMDHLHNQPCIAVWVPFNESWGQFHSKEIAEWIKQYDPSRLVDHASGWFDQGGGDFLSKHIYFKKLKSPKPDPRAFVISEFGGYSLKIPDHIWDEKKKFGYRFYTSPEALTAAYLALLKDELEPLIDQGLTAAIYTQASDVEIEINGFLTYDRKVEKMDAEALCQAHTQLISGYSRNLT